jgi:DNA-binding transcriptional LysR family regulator
LNPPFNLRELRCFVTVADEGDLARAARALGVPEVVLTESLARLETRVGAELLEPDRAGLLAPTEAGRAFWQRASDALRCAEDAISSVGPWARGESRLLLGFPRSALALARPLRRRMMQLDPSVEIDSVHLAGRELTAALRAGKIDVAIAYSTPAAPGLVGGAPSRFARYAVLPEHHPLARRERLHPDELAGMAIAGESEVVCGRPGPTPRVGLDGMWALVASGRAIGVLPEFMLSAAVGDGVRAVPLDEVEPLEVALVRRRGDARAAVLGLFELADGEGRRPEDDAGEPSRTRFVPA